MPSFANSPKSSFALAQYAACASSGVENVPKQYRLYLKQIVVCQPLLLRLIPFSPVVLSRLTDRFPAFSWSVALRKLERLLSSPFPFLWSTGDSGKLRMKRCNFTALRLILVHTYTRCSSLLQCQVCPETCPASSESMRANSPWLSGTYAIDGPITRMGVLNGI